MADSDEEAPQRPVIVEPAVPSRDTGPFRVSRSKRAARYQHALAEEIKAGSAVVDAKAGFIDAVGRLRAAEHRVSPEMLEKSRNEAAKEVDLRLGNLDGDLAEAELRKLRAEHEINQLKQAVKASKRKKGRSAQPTPSKEDAQSEKERIEARLAAIVDELEVLEMRITAHQTGEHTLSKVKLEDSNDSAMELIRERVDLKERLSQIRST